MKVGRLAWSLAAIVLLAGACSNGPAASSDLSTATASTAPATVAPTMPPSPPDQGAGVVSFGTHYNASTLVIDKGSSRFARRVAKICWSAYLNQNAGATSLTVVVARANGATETLLKKITIDVSDPTANVVAACQNLAVMADYIAGTYVLRVLRGGTVLSVGRFTLS